MSSIREPEIKTMQPELEENYNNYCRQGSDINEHLPTLKKYSSECDVVIEAGVRWVVSTWGLLAGLPKKIISVDVEHPDIFLGEGGFERIQNIARVNGVKLEFRLNSTIPNHHLRETLDISNDNVDLLFIDTLHSYNQLTKELELHSQYVNKYIILHDTTEFETRDEGGGPGLWKAIEEFVEKNKNWKIKERFTNNNGLTVLEKV